VFYLAYHLYRDYFPLLALTTYKRAMEKEAAEAA
jgi:squalene-hopene/tetraprenyl-beta-curcumene cyclase